VDGRARSRADRGAEHAAIQRQDKPIVRRVRAAEFLDDEAAVLCGGDEAFVVKENLQARPRLRLDDVMQEHRSLRIERERPGVSFAGGIRLSFQDGHDADRLGGGLGECQRACQRERDEDTTSNEREG
jgi:hypothetical protein